MESLLKNDDFLLKNGRLFCDLRYDLPEDVTAFIHCVGKKAIVEFCIKNDELSIENDDILIENGELCINNDDFWRDRTYRPQGQDGGRELFGSVAGGFECLREVPGAPRAAGRQAAGVPDPGGGGAAIGLRKRRLL